MLAGLLVFLMLPRTDAVRFGGLPFKGFPGLPLASGGVENPGLPFGGRGGDGTSVFNPLAYFGLAESVDVRTVGELSDAPVMRVRAERPRFWRGMVFDRYENGSWSRSAPIPDPKFGVPIGLAAGWGPRAQLDTLVQTYELVTDTPNLIFAAPDAVEVFTSAGSVHEWDDGTITTSGIQEEGTVYSVVSLVDRSDAGTLRAAVGDVPSDVIATYTDVPADLPQRVIDLGQRITAEADTVYAKAEAVMSWMAANTEYSLVLEPLPADADPVDQLLFERRKGWCEPIATSMVMLLRASGVPARFATGFAPGSHNPFTGWFEVITSDAHAWVEAYVPGHGWTAFDPTFAVPQAIDGRSLSRFAVLDLFTWFGRTVATLLPEPVRDAARAVVGFARDNAVLVITALTAAVTAVSVLSVRRRRRRTREAIPHDPFSRLARLLARHGVGRDEWQTPREYVGRVRLHRPDVPTNPLERLLTWEETRRYAPGVEPPPLDEVERALDEVEASLVPSTR